MCINLLVVCKYAANGVVSELIDANTHVVSLLQPASVEYSYNVHTVTFIAKESGLHAALPWDGLSYGYVHAWCMCVISIAVKKWVI